MKVYVIYDREGWEILGIAKCFATRRHAEEYMNECFESYDADKEHRSFSYTRKEWEMVYGGIHEIEVDE